MYCAHPDHTDQKVSNSARAGSHVHFNRPLIIASSFVSYSSQIISSTEATRGDHTQVHNRHVCQPDHIKASLQGHLHIVPYPHRVPDPNGRSKPPI